MVGSLRPCARVRSLRLRASERACVHASERACTRASRAAADRMRFKNALRMLIGDDARNGFYARETKRSMHIRLDSNHMHGSTQSCAPASKRWRVREGARGSGLVSARADARQDVELEVEHVGHCQRGWSTTRSTLPPRARRTVRLAEVPSSSLGSHAYGNRHSRGSAKIAAE